MLTALLLGAVALKAVQVRAQSATFTPITDYPAFNQLPKACLQTCIQHAGGGGTVDFTQLESTETACKALNATTLDHVGQCTTGYPSCFADGTEQYDAESVLFDYCADVARNFSFTGPSVTLATPDPSQASATTFVSLALSATASSSASSITPQSTTSTANPTTPTPSQTGSAQSTPTDAAASAASPPPALTNNGLSTGAKAGIGVGVGLGVPLLAGIAAVLFFARRRRRTQNSRPYNAVSPSDKDVRYDEGSPHMPPQEMRPMSSGSPFLPPIITTHSTGAARSPQPYEEEERSPRPMSGGSDPAKYMHQSPTSFVSSASAQPRPQTAETTTTRHSALSEPEHAEEAEEPPSPVSPVSPISPSGSRPPSGRVSHDNHDF